MEEKDVVWCGGTYPMITQWRKTLFHPSLCVHVPADEEGYEEDEDGADDGPFYYVCCLLER